MTWTNDDTVGHTATSGQVTDTQYGTIWDSSLIKAGGSFTSPPFTTAGTYPYLCMVHPWMTGEIIVGTTSTSPPAIPTTPTPKIPPTTNSITVSTDKSSYNYGDTITISGTASNFVFEAPVTVIVRNPIGNIVMVHQVILGTDRTYSTVVTANTGVWQNAGTYTVYVQLGGAGTSAITTFNFNSNGNAISPTTNNTSKSTSSIPQSTTIPPGFDGIVKQQIVTNEGIFYVEAVKITESSNGIQKFVDVYLTYKNNHASIQYLGPIDFSLIDNTGQTYNADITESTFPTIHVMPADTVRGKLSFVINGQSNPSALVYSNLFATRITIGLAEELSPPDTIPKSDWDLTPVSNASYSDNEYNLRIINETFEGNNPTTVLVNVELSNIGDQTQSYNILYFYAKDQYGNTYGPDLENSNFGSGDLYPNKSTFGSIQFTIPNLASNQIMIIYTDGFSNQILNSGTLPEVIQNSLTTQSESPTTTPTIQPSISETNQTLTSQTPMKTYQNNAYNFTIQYPFDWLIEENYVSGNGNIGIVKFKSDESETASLSVWGEMENTQQLTGNQYLNKMLEDEKQYCDKNNCTFQLEKSLITQTNGLTHYIITGNQYWVTTISNSTVATAQFYIEDDVFNGNDIWKLYGYSSVTDSSDIPKATAYYDEIAKSLVSFTILGTSQSTSSISSLITSSTNQSTTSIPSWIHNTAKWWSEGSVGDNDFVKGVQYLIQQKIITIPNTTQSNTQSTNQIPPWVKGIAGWWADGKISDSEFIRGIQFLVQAGIIKV